MRRDSFLRQVLMAVARSTPATNHVRVVTADMGTTRPASSLFIAISRTTPAFTPGSDQTLNTSTSPRAARQPGSATSVLHVATNAESADDVVEFDVRVPSTPRSRSYRQALIVAFAALTVPVILASIVFIKTVTQTGYIPTPTALVTPLAPPSRNPTPTAPGTDPTPGSTGVFAEEATAAQLMQALLPAQALSATATVATAGADLANATTLCGAPLPMGAQRATYKTLVDDQTGQYLEEIIIKFDNPAGVTALINSDHAALDQAGSCIISSSGQTIQYTGDYQNPVPPGCDNGLSTQVSIQPALLLGFTASAQCGSYAITVEILSKLGGIATQVTADGYLNIAVERLQQSLAQS